jgi:hypothetical protein
VILGLPRESCHPEPERGLLPLAHSGFDPYESFFEEIKESKTILDTFRIVCKHLDRAESMGIDKRADSTRRVLGSEYSSRSGYPLFGFCSSTLPSAVIPPSSFRRTMMLLGLMSR